MGDPGRNIGFTTTCNVGVDFETIVVLFQSTVTSLGLLIDCPQRSEGERTIPVRRRQR
jgi:hypothetical protein